MARKVMVNGLDIGYIPPSAAADVVYDNTTSGLASTTVQGAVDIVSTKLGKVITGTIAAGSTAVTLTDSSITTSSMIDGYFEDVLSAPTNVTVSNGSITIEVDAPEEDLGVAVKVFNL